MQKKIRKNWLVVVFQQQFCDAVKQLWQLCRFFPLVIPDLLQIINSRPPGKITTK